MGENALQEPAILHLIFIELSQLDLIHAQAVCRTWRRTILISNVFLQELSLRPRLSQPATGDGDQPEDPSTRDGLLQHTFRSFLDWSFICWDGCRGNAGPWTWTAERNWTDNLCNYERFRHPEASWRRMLPWNDPPPTQLQVHIEERHRGTIARLNFDNEKTWLTFGLLWDIVENAWFHGNPHWIKMMSLEGPGQERSWSNRGPLPQDAKVSDEVRQSMLRRPGRINLSLTVDDRTQEERTKAREKALKDRVASIKKQERRIIRPCGTKPRRVTACDRHVFTNEFHVEGSVAFGDVGWDEVWTYEREEQAVVVPERSRRKFLGRIWDGGLLPLIHFDRRENT